jgi:hypothetical protein
LFEDLAMHGSLTPRRGGCITFLLPDDKLVKEIRKTIESDRPEDATDMLSALILTDLFEDASDFKEKQDDIPNLLGKRLVIKGISGNKVMVDGGELTVDAKFKPFERQGTAKRGNLAVWNLKGTVDYQNAPAATFKNIKKGGKPKKGGDESDDKLKALMMDIVDKEVKSVAEGTKGADGKFLSPMLSAVARVLRVLKSDAKYQDELYKAKSLLTKHHVVDFYLLFHNPDMFARSRLLEIYNAGVDSANDVDTIINFVKDKVADNCYTLKGTAEFNPGFEDRRDCLGQVNPNLNISNTIKVLYDKVDENNKFIYGNGSFSNKLIYPENVATLFKMNRGMHASLDEFKFFVCTAVKKIRDSIPNNWEEKPNGRSAVASEYAELFSTIHRLYPKLGIVKNNSLLNLPVIDNQDVSLIEKFKNTFVFHLPGMKENDEDNEYRVVKGGEDDEECDVKDIDTEIEDSLQQFSNCDMCLSPNTVNELKAYMKANGGKMPEL